jgi:hypothetical protein
MKKLSDEIARAGIEPLFRALRGGSIEIIDKHRKPMMKHRIKPDAVTLDSKGSIHIAPFHAYFVKTGTMSRVVYRKRSGKIIMSGPVSTDDPMAMLQTITTSVWEGDTFAIIGGIEIKRGTLT